MLDMLKLHADALAAGMVPDSPPAMPLQRWAECWLNARSQSMNLLTKAAGLRTSQLGLPINVFSKPYPHQRQQCNYS